MSNNQTQGKKWDAEKTKQYHRERQRVIYEKYLAYDDMKTQYDSIVKENEQLRDNYNRLENNYSKLYEMYNKILEKCNRLEWLMKMVMNKKLKDG